MSLDWSLYLDNDALPTREEIEQSPQYEYSWRFSAQPLVALDPVPEPVRKSCFNDMVPPQMTALGEDLEHLATGELSELSEPERETVQEAAKWLLYWSDEGFSVIAWH